MPGYGEWDPLCIPVISVSLRDPLSGTTREGGGDESSKLPLSLFPGWLLPSHQVKSLCAGSRPEEGVEYKRNREEKHQWRIGDLSWYEGGDIFSVTVQEYSLFKSEQVPPDGTSGASFLVS